MAPTRTPKRHVHLWSTLERHMVFIAFTEYEQTSAECARLFNYHFAANFATPPDAERIRDEYATRNGAGRSKMWERQIERDVYTQQQEAQRVQAHGMIQVAAQALGITLNLRANTPAAGAGAVAGAVAPVPQTHAATNPTDAAEGDADDSSVLSSPPASPMAPPSAPLQGSSGAADTTASPSGSKRKRDEDSDDSSVLSSPPASPIAGPIPAAQGSSSVNSNSAGPDAAKPKREDEEESEAGEEGQDEPSNSDENVEQNEPPQLTPARSAQVQIPPPASTTPTQARPKKNKSPATSSRPAKNRRATRQTTREDDETRNARPGYPTHYTFMARNQFEPNSRLLALLDKRWENMQSGEAQQAPVEAQQAPVEAQQAPVEAQQAPAEVQQPPVQPDAEVAHILRQAAVQAARIAKARAFGAAILARTVVPGQ